MLFEVGRGDIVEDQVGLERKQIAQPQEQLALDLRLAGVELIQCAVPLRQLAEGHLHAWGAAGLALLFIAPLHQPAATVAVADEVVIQPARQPVFARRDAQAVGHQHQRSIGQRCPAGTAATGQTVQDGLQPEFAPQLLRYQHRTPVPCLHGFGL